MFSTDRLAVLRWCRKVAILTFGSVHLLWFGTVSGQTLQTLVGGGEGLLRKGPLVEQISRMRS